MDTPQTLTELTPQKQLWVDYVATGGMTIDYEGKPTKMTAEQLARKLKVHRRTLYDWSDNTPNFWEHVKARRNEIFGRSAMTLVYNAMLKKAANGDVAAAKLVMQQAQILQAEKVDHTTNGKDIPTPILANLFPKEPEAE